MALNDIPGHEGVIAVFGECSLCDFPDLDFFCLDTYYNEDREVFEKILTIRMKGGKGRIEIMLGNVSSVTLQDAHQITGLDIKSIADRGWDRKKFEIRDYEENRIAGFAEQAAVSAVKEKW